VEKLGREAVMKLRTLWAVASVPKVRGLALRVMIMVISLPE
jgi:hypothetical protein